MAAASGTGEITWGPYYLLSPFPGKETGSLPLVLEPESELPRLAAGGPGPDLEAKYRGKNGIEVSWQKMPEEKFADNRPIDLKVHKDPTLNEQATCYLYRTITCTKPASIVVSMGSDDGLRFWLNGALLVDADEAPLDPAAHRIKLNQARTTTSSPRSAR
jgi:hypothetical protein